MARRLLPDDLTPAQVIALQDALLENADTLLRAAQTMLEAQHVPLARSLAILGMEESGKAIALHERRVAMAEAPEGESFVDERLHDLWGQHGRKLEAVHRFLVEERYWFGEPADPAENARALGTIRQWQTEHNTLKQRGFYVDVTPEGDPISPQEASDAEAVRRVLDHVHQIGWQIRLGEHIERTTRLERERGQPGPSDEEIAQTREALRRRPPEEVEQFVSLLQRRSRGEQLNNAAYAFPVPEHPFANVGKPGYEAHDHHLQEVFEGTENGEGGEDPPAE